MSTVHPAIDDPQLGRLTRAETTLDDGDTAVHDWFTGSIRLGDSDVDLIIDGADVESVQQLLPRAKALVADIDGIRLRAARAILTTFSDVEPTEAELTDGVTDLHLDAIETTADETVLHFTDICGEHFPDGYWPAAHLDPDRAVTQVTVES